MRLNSVTLAKNDSTAGSSGLHISSTTQVWLTNTLMTDGVTGNDCNDDPGTIQDNVNGIIVTNGTCFAPITTTNPALSLLADNGGDSLTHAFGAGSSADNTGDNTTCPATDQRGYPRSDGSCDIGAFELNATAPSPPFDIDVVPGDDYVNMTFDGQNFTATGPSARLGIHILSGTLAITDVTISTGIGASGVQSGTLTIDAPIDINALSARRSLVLTANYELIVDEPISTSATGNTDKTDILDLSLHAAENNIDVGEDIDVGQYNDNFDECGHVQMIAPLGSIQTKNITTGNYIASGNGIRSSGHITLTAPQGSIVVSGDLDTSSHNGDAASQQGGAVTLSANLSIVVSGRLNTYSRVDGAEGVTAGSGGAVSVTSFSSEVNLAGGIDSSASLPNGVGTGNSVADGGRIDISANQNVTIGGDISSYTLADVGHSGGSSKVTIGASGAIAITSTIGTVSVSGNMDASVSSETESGNNDGETKAPQGGGITLTGLDVSVDGGIDTSAKAEGDDALPDSSSAITAASSDLKIVATQSVTVSGNISTYSRIETQSNGHTSAVGSVMITATNGNVSLGNIDSSSYALGTTRSISVTGAGAVQVFAAEKLYVGAIDSSAYAQIGVNGTFAAFALGGGAVTLDGTTISVSGDIESEARAVNTNSGADTLAYAGAGGNVTIATKGELTLQGIDTTSFAEGTPGFLSISAPDPLGGDITLISGDTLQMNGPITTSVQTIKGSEGRPGGVAISVTNNIRLSHYISATGHLTSALLGATVQITSNKFVRLDGQTTCTAGNCSIAANDPITITHGGSGVTPFIVGDSITNGTAGALQSHTTNIVPTNSYTNTHQEGNQIWIISVVTSLFLDSVAPIRHTVDNSPITNIVLTYSTELESSTITSNTIVMHGMSRGKLNGTYSVLSNVATIDPSGNIRPGELVYVSATTNTQGTDGTVPTTPTVWQFRIGVMGDGKGAMSAQPILATFSSGDLYDVALGDLDDDGDLDAIVARSNMTQQVYHNDGTGQFSFQADLTSIDGWAVELGDLDNDGDLDAVFANHGQPNNVFRNDGGGSWTALGTFGAALNTGYVVLGDIDGDLDVLASTEGEAVNLTVHLNDGIGNFSDHPTTPTIGINDVTTMVLGDLDSDGDLDLVTANNDPYDSVIYKNDGLGNFTMSSTFGLGYNQDVVLGDLDHDGDLDLIFARDIGSVAEAVFLNDGTGAFTAGSTFGDSTSYGIALGDLDADNDLDVIVANGSSEVNQVYLNDGAANFTAQPLDPTFGGGNSFRVAMGDVDNDGDLDAVLANNSTNATVFLNRTATDLTIEKTVSPTTASAGETLVFTNDGPHTAKKVVLTDTLPVSLTNITIISSGVSLTETNSAPYVWQAADMTVGTTGTITLTALILGGGTLVNSVEISGTGDTTPTNNTAAITLTAVAGACYATHDNGATVFNSVDASAVQSAVDAASSGDTVKLAGSCVGVTAGQVVSIGKAMTLSGGYTTTDNFATADTTNPTLLDAVGLGRVMVASTNEIINLENLDLTRGDAGAADGGGLYIDGADVQLTNVRIYSNQAVNGGGVRVGSTLTLNGGTVISDNTATNGAGVYVDGASTSALHLNGGEIISNAASTSGGGVYLNTSTTLFTLTSGTVASNSSSSHGGGVFINAGTMTMNGGQVVSNSTLSGGVSGGGVYLSTSDAQLVLTHGDIAYNSVSSNGFGGAVAVNAGSMTMSGGQLFDNDVATGTGGGGGLWLNNGSAQLTGGDIISNAAPVGGGLMLQDGTIQLDGSQILNNTTSSDGGGVSHWGSGTITQTSATTIAYNTARSGGGVYVRLNGRYTLNGGDIVSNTTSTMEGGGVYLKEGVVFTQTGGRIAYNQSNSDGGGIYLAHNTSVFTQTGGQIAFNQATNSGGGIYIVNGVITLTNSLLLTNTAGLNGGAIHQNNGRTTVSNSCIVGNSAPAVHHAGGTTPMNLNDNWWGTNDGPSGVGPGNGDPVSNNVDFSGFLTSAPFAACLTFPVVADLAVSKAVVPVTAKVGETITYTLSFTNSGPKTATNIVITDTLPISLSVTSVVSSGVSLTQTSTVPYVWTAADMPINSVGYLTLTGQVTGGGSLVNSVEITSTLDISLTNNTATVTTTVAGACYATHDNGTTVFNSTNANAVQEAVDAASAGDTVKVAGYCAGVQPNGGNDQTVYIAKSLTVQGGYTATDWTTSNPSVYTPTLDALSAGRVFYIDGTNDVTLDNLWVTNGRTTGINDHGAGIYNSGTTLTLNRLRVYSNVTAAASDADGGAIYTNQMLTIRDSQVYSNTASDHGGALYVIGPDYHITDSQFYGNSAKQGAVIYYRSGSVGHITRTSMTSNTASNRGGGIRGGESSSDLHITDSTISYNTAGSGGGAMFVSPGIVYLTNITVANNTASGIGGALWIQDDLFLNSTTIRENQSTGNQAGGVYVNTGDVYVSKGTIESNTSAATRNGGGMIVNGGTLYMTGTTIISNVSGQDGGGIYLRKSAYITNSQILHNTAAQQGGGLYLLGNGAIHQIGILNSLLVGNAATNEGQAIYLEQENGDDITIIRHTTIASPTVSSAQALYLADGQLVIFNSIVASHTVGIEQVGGSTTEDYNLFFGNGSNSSGGVISSGNSVAGDPLFVNPAGNDYRLSLNSEAIDAGTDLGITTDFEGDARPFSNAIPDIGYDESPYSRIVDLAIAKYVTPASSLPGGPITYTLTFSNQGALTATDVVISDVVPSSVTTLSVTTSGATITATGSGNNLSWQVQDLAGGQNGVITILGQLTDTLAVGEVNNTAIITSTKVETNTTNNTSVVTTTILNAPPVMSTVADQTMTEQETITLTVVATDTNGDFLIYYTEAQPFGSNFAEISGKGVFNWSPIESDGFDVHTVIFAVDDGTTIVTQTVLITVTEVNTAPIINPISDQTIAESNTLTFTATDLPAQTLTFTLASPIAGSSLTTGGLFSWTPSESDGPGVYSTTVVVSDGSLTDSQTVLITVTESNAAPVLTAISGQTIAESNTLTFTATATDTDLPAQTLTFTLASPIAGSSLTTGGLFSWTPSESDGPGVYSTTVVVSDGSLTDSQTVLITVTESNTAPILTAISDQTIAESNTLTFTVTATDTDLPAQTLTFTLASPIAGSSLTTGGLFSWTPSESDGPGVYSTTVVVSDGSLTDSQTVLITVTESNVAPILTAISGQTIAESNTLTFTATATDTDLPAQTLTFTLASPIAGASLTTGGVFSWTPTVTGNYSTTVVVSDGSLTDSQTVLITVTESNTAPILTAISDQTIAESNTLTFTATATDTDLPAQTLTFTLISPIAGSSLTTGGNFSWTPNESDGPGVYSTTVVVSDGALTDSQAVLITVTESNNAPVLTTINPQTIVESNTLTFTATATDTDLPAQTLTFTLISPIAGASLTTGGNFSWTTSESDGPGVYSTTVVVSDGALTDSQTVLITVTESNNAPVLTTINPQTIVENNTLTFTATATDTDLPAQTLTFTLQSTLTGSSLTAGGLFSWPTNDSDGPATYEVTVIVLDGTLTDSQVVTITVTESNVAPVIGSISDQTVAEGATISFTVTATDTDLPAQPLTFSLLNNATRAVIVGLDATSALLSWTTTESNGPGVYPFTVQVSDGALTDTATFSVTVSEINSPPTLNPISDQTVSEGATISFTVTATDTDLPAQSLTFTLQSGPEGASFASNGSFSWLTSEVDGGSGYSATVVVSDGSLTDSQTVLLTVTEINNAPSFTNLSDKVINEGETLTFTVTATDTDLPAQTLSFSLQSGPTDATLTRDGQFSWATTTTDGGRVYPATFAVSDGILTTSQTISLTVIDISQAELVLSKAVNPATASLGDTVTYTLRLTNAGLMTATNVVLTDILPTELTNSTVSHNGVVIGTSGQFVWTLTDLVPNQVGLITMTGQLPMSSSLNGATTINNQAVVSTATSETNTANNTATAQFNVVPFVAPQAVVLSGPTSGLVGDQLVYQASVRPANSSIPLTYTWTAQDQQTVQTRTSLTDSLSIIWSSAGQFPITVIAQNPAGSATGSLLVTINAPATVVTPVINLSASSYVINESEPLVAVTVVLTASSANTVTVAYATSEGTATASSDYGTTLGTITFAPGVVNQTVTIPILDDATFEGNETFQLALSSGVNGTLGTVSAATITIVDNDSLISDILAVSKTTSPTQTALGNTVTYDIVLQNVSTISATNVVLTDTWPADNNGLAGFYGFESGRVAQVGIVALQDGAVRPCNLSGARLVCTVGTLPAGSQARVNLQLTPRLVGSLVSTVEVRLAENDPNLANNSATVTTTVLEQLVQQAGASADGPTRVYLPLLSKD